MNTCQLTFIIDPVNETTELRIIESGLEATVGSHGRLNFVIVDAQMDAFLGDAIAIGRKLETLGARVRRLDLDLVTQAAIAARAGVSRAAVSKWVATTTPVGSFPTPHTNTPTPVWTWHCVNEWMRRTGKQGYDDSCPASWQEVADFNAVWERERGTTEVREVAYAKEAVPAERLRRSGWERLASADQR